ncbi:hypothetical protein ES319_D09G064100v1 [Gossypium barbadense]|uniref:Uncharacterized protein n=1 Tax=Gossypium barbadense TaxID=3634 RepID=A0A5J5Q1B2_GOSBA|nr:hypothetical protein ES319_D09G064100v1 [Gossypium barbadense]
MHNPSLEYYYKVAAYSKGRESPKEKISTAPQRKRSLPGKDILNRYTSLSRKREEMELQLDSIKVLI